ncbi:MAG: gamma-glutamyltransferase [Acidobacteriaceae bacterium]|nr:gamma-glutamyltransferase [Acidobacteriaceae bacterium]
MQWKQFRHIDARSGSLRAKAALLVLLLPFSSIAQEKSQSGLELKAARAMVDQPVRAPHAMIASANALATEAGLKVLREGGNAVDAAVAVAVALAVVHPEAGNLGGSGHMLIRMHDGQVAAIDYSGMSPAATNSETSWKDLQYGYRSAAVPGTPAGIGMAHDKFGQLSWRRCLQPAYELASKGFPASERMELILSLQVPVMKQFPESSKVFMHGADKPLKQGEWVKQQDLAKTIARMQAKGWQEFYTGKTAELIAADMAAHGGWITTEDLRNYRAEIHEPIRFTYRGNQVLTVPPSASGGLTEAVALNTLENESLPVGSEGSSQARHLQVEALRRGFEAARLYERTDEKAPLSAFLSKSYAAKLSASILPDKASEITVSDPDTHESTETTHFSVIDSDGNMVSNTYTLSGYYGSQVMAAGTGVLLNNHMSVFNHDPHTKYFLAPHQRYISTLAPTILLHQDGTPWAAFGTPGAATIPSTVVQMMNNLVDFKMSLRDAIEYPRIHYDLRHNVIEAEPGALVVDVADRLEAMGYKLNPKLRSQGDVNAVEVEEGTGWRVGSSDGRRGGAAEGY